MPDRNAPAPTTAPTTAPVTATVTASDIARIAGVGRAAVSNWRRRFDDFPTPVAGTSSSPLFALAAVETWFDRHGRPFQVEAGDRVWQQIRGTVDDPHLGELVGHLGGFLLYRQREREAADVTLGEPDDVAARLLGPAIDRAASELPHRSPGAAPSSGWEASWVPVARTAATAADQAGYPALFEVLRQRYREVYSRQVGGPPAAVADLMVRLAGVRRGAEELTVLDPACGVGGLLDAARAAGAGRLLGQDVDPTAARITAAGLLLHGADARIAAADSLLADAFTGEQADVVLCAPPSGQRSWGHEDLLGSPWWRYGVPPRGEPELAWLQHCLAHGRPGAAVLLVLPAAAASRPAGRRIRANLLRAGALRAVLELPPDVFGAGSTPDLWVLRVPDGRPPDPRVLMGLAGADLRTVSAEPSPGYRRVPVADLLDDQVDLSPRPRVAVLPADGAERGFPAVREKLRTALSSLSALTASMSPPALSVSAGEPTSVAASAASPETGRVAPSAWNTVGELTKEGALAMLTASLQTRADGGDLPMFTAGDVRHDRGPTGRTGDRAGMLRLQAGDVVCVTTDGGIAATVIEEAGAVLGPKVALLRVDPDRLDPHFLAGSLRAAGSRPAAAHGRGDDDPDRGRPAGTLSLPDLRRIPIPALELADQRELAADFHRLGQLEKAVRQVSELGAEIIQIGYLGAVDSRRRPGDRTRS
ncbi:HsdM family class I SAM-dependent methyltransferase [Parafrankia elaeagni]|uniref:HsdM family class I SAM-dependent methyltransferase n=1 Tax=Parafrankia elaeagni TaxID=222534 RepID=UPI00035C4426|nr:N-6 DNA methylase [Parafrankia elaeagni]